MNYTKDPGDTLDWAFDWTEWLATDETISSYVLTVSEGITLETEGEIAQKESGGVVTYWLSGGTAGNWYTVACKITTNANRVKVHTMNFNVVNR